MGASSGENAHHHEVNFSSTRSFATAFKSDLKETFFPDDPFRHFKNQSHLGRLKKASQYFIPIFEWMPKYTLRSFRYDVLAGMTITSLAIPQGISYAKLANIPPIIGLYCSFVPPLVYACFGSSRDLAVGNVAAASLLLAEGISSAVSEKDDPVLYLHLIFTATFITGVFQAFLGIFRLGIIVDFLSHSTIVGFMSGTAVIICLQQLKGMLGLKHFTKKTDVVSVLHAVFSQIHEWRWESAVFGIIFLVFLLCTRHLRKIKPKLFWVNAIAPLVTVVIGCVFAYLTHSDKHGIATVGPLNKGLSPISIQYLNFDSKYLPTVLSTGIITGILGLAEGIAIARSFAMLKNEDHIDGNKEMIAFGMMNIAGSFTSCYMTTGPFSKSAINHNAGCKTAMSNVVMSIFMMLTLLFLAPLFSYTPLVSLSAIIMTAMLGLIEYEEAYRLFKVDKFDFCIAVSAFLGVAFLSMDIGLMISVGLSILRALLYVARPAVSNIKRIPNSKLYRDVEQYPLANGVSGIVILKLGSPVYFANASYVKERISRAIEEESSTAKNKDGIGHVILDLGGVTSIDMTGVQMLFEIRKNAEKKGIKVALSNPRLDVTEKLLRSKFVDIVGKNSIFISVDEAVEACHSTHESKKSVLRIAEAEEEEYIDEEKLSRCSSLNLH